MDGVFDFFVKHKEEIYVAIIATAICSGFAFLFKKIVTIKKRLLPQSLSEPEEAVKLNIPENLLDDSCVGRKKLLEKVLNKIADGKKKLFIKKCVLITGEEGIGKTLFCYTLFQYYLKKYPVYLGWIECNNKQSIFDIINSTFEDLRFRRKNKEAILKGFTRLDRPCILFVDQINQFTSLDELEELSHCANVILILSGLLRKINFANDTFILPPLSNKDAQSIFERQAREGVEMMNKRNKDSVKCLLEDYAKGNPALVIAFADAKYHYNNSWEDVLKNVKMCEYNEENYLNDIYRRLYKINELSVDQRSALSKLSTIKYLDYTESVLELLDVSAFCVRTLCNLYWLEQKNSVLYYMDKTHRNVAAKIFPFHINMEKTIDSVNTYLLIEECNGFRWISLYIEDILKKVKGDAPHIMEKEIFFRFAYNVALNYKDVENFEKSLEWIDLCKPIDAKFSYDKLLLEFQIKLKMFGTIFSDFEVEQAYYAALNQAKVIDNFESNEKFIMQEYCNFLYHSNRNEDGISLCKEYFEIYGMNLNDKNNLIMFLRYLHGANLLEDNDLLKRLTGETIIKSLYQNEKLTIAVAWSFGLLGKIYMKCGDKETADRYIRHMVVLVNEEKGFFDSYIKDYLKISDMEFAEYMHSCDELLNSLKDALVRGDAEALYIEGRYQEKYGNYNDAFLLYEEAATRDSLRGMCSLALLYYRGQGEPRDYDKARRYLDYCCERGHRGSNYWLGILLLDTNYSYPGRDYDEDKNLALQHLTKAAELGSERAKQKLLEF